MSLTTLTTDLNNVTNLANQPTESAEELKSIFDKAGNTIKDYINNTLLPEIESTYLPKSGGTMTGTLVSRDIQPNSTRTYSLGSSTRQYSNVYANSLIQYNPLTIGSTTYATHSYGFCWNGHALRLIMNGDSKQTSNMYLTHMNDNDCRLTWDSTYNNLKFTIGSSSSSSIGSGNFLYSTNNMAKVTWSAPALRLYIDGTDQGSIVTAPNNPVRLSWTGSKLAVYVDNTMVGYVSLTS